MDRSLNDEHNESGLGIAWVNIALMALILVVCILAVNMDSNKGVADGTTSYVTQLEWIAGSKGYTTDGKTTYKDRLQLETEDGRYVEVMKYLEDTEVSESEFQEIKDIQSKYQQGISQVNKSETQSYGAIIAFLFVILSGLSLMLLFKLIQYQ